MKAVPERCAKLPVLWKNTRQKAEKPKVGYHIIYKKKLISVLFGNKAAEKDDGRTRLSEFRKFETGEKNGGFGQKRSKYEQRQANCGRKPFILQIVHSSPIAKIGNCAIIYTVISTRTY